MIQRLKGVLNGVIIHQVEIHYCRSTPMHETPEEQLTTSPI